MKRIVSGMLLLALACALAMPALAATTDGAPPYLTVSDSITVTIGQTVSTGFSTNAQSFERVSRNRDVAEVSKDGTTIKGIAVGSTTILFEAYFGSSMIQKTIGVTVTEKALKKPASRFALSEALGNKLRANADADASIGFAIADLNIRDAAGKLVGVLQAGELAAVRKIGDERVDIIAANGALGSVDGTSFITVSTAEDVASVNQENAILRLGPSTSAGFLGKVGKGEKLPVVATEGNWALVISGKNAAYIAGNRLSSSSESADATNSGIAPTADALTLKVGEEAEVPYVVKDPTATYQGIKQGWVYTNPEIANGKTGNSGIAVGIKPGTTYAYGTDYAAKIHLVVINVIAADENAAPSAETQTNTEPDPIYGTKYVATSASSVWSDTTSSAQKLGMTRRGATVYGNDAGDGFVHITKCDTSPALVGGYVRSKTLTEAK